MGSQTAVGCADPNNIHEQRSPKPLSPAHLRCAGFTLFELLIVLVIAAIILGLGSPSFSDFRRNSRLTSAANDLLAAGQFARTEAIKRQSIVSICPSAAPGDPEPACGGASFSGWITFVDTDGDCLHSAGEEVLRADGPIDERTMIANANGSCISFASNGFSRVVGGPSDASRILFCDVQWGTELQESTGLSAARGINISQTGRTEIVRDKERIDEWGLACAR
jgi:type IV fimbrial biogenesis protein FimT